MNPLSQRASCIETISAFPVAANTVLTQDSFMLGQFPRASSLAALYKFYKAEYVEWEYTPQYNTFQDDINDTNQQIPYMYTIMNRTQDANIVPFAQTVQYFQSQGVTPKKFTSKVVIRYKPNWCSPGLIMQRLNPNPNTPFLDGIASSGHKIEYGWLASPDTGSTGRPSTTMTIVNPDPQTFPAGFNIPQSFPLSTVYNGHVTFFSQGPNFTTSQKVGTLVCRVKWAFKQPGFLAPTPPPTSVDVPEVAKPTEV